MRIILHIGPEQVGAERLQSLLAENREALAADGVLVPKSPGARNHTRLYMAVTDPDHVDPLRFNRGYGHPGRQAGLLASVRADLTREVAATKPEVMILTCAQLGASLHRLSELERLKALLTPLSDDIRVLAHLDEPARLLSRHYARQVLDGRAVSLAEELALAGEPDWWDGAMARMPQIAPAHGVFEETQGLPFWMDYTRLADHWEGVFGPGSVILRGFEAKRFDGKGILGEAAEGFGITADLEVALPGLEREDAQKLIDAAHQICPYSNATRGNVDVGLSLA